MARPELDCRFSIRVMIPGDITAVLDIAGCCPELAPWSRSDYELATQGVFDGWVAESSSNGHSRVAAFLLARRVADELEILNLAVEASARRLGIASRLLQLSLARGRASGAKRAFLEVRASNSGALSFYRHHGFVSLGRRSRYYSNPPEDALMFSRQLP